MFATRPKVSCQSLDSKGAFSLNEVCLFRQNHRSFSLGLASKFEEGYDRTWTMSDKDPLTWGCVSDQTPRLCSVPPATVTQFLDGVSYGGICSCFSEVREANAVT